MTRSMFQGVRVLDLSRVIAGPYCTALLADLGADVVKVESVDHGDPMRASGPTSRGESCFFVVHNRSKRSLALDLKHPEGLRVMRELCPHFDVVVENFRPGVMRALGLDYEAVRALRRDVVYLSISGYGQGNARSGLPAYDNIIQCEAGLAWLNGPPGSGAPQRSPLSISDYAAALYGAFAVSSALFHRGRTGEGQYIDVAMFDTLVSVMDAAFLIADMHRGEIDSATDHTASLEALGLMSLGNRHPGASPHGFFRTTDGHVAHMSLTDAMWRDLLGVLGRDDLVGDARYATLEARKSRWREVDAVIEAWTSTRSTDEVIGVLQARGLPCGRARTVDQVAADPHMAERGVFTPVDHPVAGRVQVPSVPIKFSGAPAAITRPSPLLGEDSSDVLKEILGYSDDDVQRLAAKGVLRLGAVTQEAPPDR
jgi:crotonobetainyl-CoA:carnitine CoA-transferase CaiB-like acyl-CoA transferase